MGDFRAEIQEDFVPDKQDEGRFRMVPRQLEQGNAQHRGIAEAEIEVVGPLDAALLNREKNALLEPEAMAQAEFAKVLCQLHFLVRPEFNPQ